jgi:hypothetical protein
MTSCFELEQGDKPVALVNSLRLALELISSLRAITGEPRFRWARRLQTIDCREGDTATAMPMDVVRGPASAKQHN